MNINTKILSFCFLFVAGIATSQTLEQKALHRIDSLETLIAEAELAGIDALKEKMTIRTAEVFLKYANWDENHIAENKAAFDLVSRYKDQSQKYAEDLPDFERGEVVTMLDEAITTLHAIKKGEISRKPSPNIDWAKVSHNGDQLSYNGRPVFLADYTWKPTIEELTEYHGNEDGYYFDPNKVSNESGSLNSWMLKELNSKPDGSIGFIFLGNKSVPSWSENKYGPGFKMREDTYTGYDIDNPGAKELLGYLFKGTIPKMAGKKYSELGYMLCNEPHFYTTKTGDKWDWASGPVSEYTFAKFRTWLAEKHDSIAALNSAWGTAYNSFDAVSISIPMDNSKQGTPLWYDWQVFNNYRVTEWYKWVKSEIRKYDSEAKVHLKVMPNLWTENKRGHGLDMEALTELSDIIGNDFGSENSYMWGGPKEWETHYALEWREFCMGHDFFKSVSPEKICYNTELHYLSKGNFRDLNLDPMYARATFWLSHTLGASANQIWFWARQADGSIKSNAGKGYAGSNNHQPRIINEVHSTMMDLNSYSEEIMAMQRQKKPIRIFYSETSAQNKPKHMDDVFEIYESLAFEGIPIGFATKNIISNQNNRDWEVILVHKTQYLTQAEYDTLRSYVDHGGIVITDAASMLKNEYGKPIASLSLENDAWITVGSLAEMKLKALEIVSNKGLEPEIILSESNTGGHKGCFWKCIKNEDGNNVLSVVNLGKSNAMLNIELKGAKTGTSCTDMLTGVAVSSTPVLKPYEVFFVEIKDAVDVSAVRKNKLNTSLDAKLYPNPSGGNFKVEFKSVQKDVKMQVFDIVGRQIESLEYSSIQSFSSNLTSQPNGIYLLRIIAGNQAQTLNYIKE